jgi:retron-type reverse transcriptase
LWNIDLKDFFPSIPKKRVTAAFEGMGYPFVAAYFLAGLCCLRGSLPQGAPTSPALSNIIFNKVDIALSELVDGKNIIYTRYADDLSFSGMKPIPVSFQRQVIRLLKTNGYFVQLKKSRLMGPAMRREVTGLTINEKVSLPRVRRRKLRAYFHDISLNPAAHSKKRTEALGFASWVKNHHPSEGRYYMEIALGIPLEPVSGDTA